MQQSYHLPQSDFVRTIEFTTSQEVKEQLITAEYHSWLSKMLPTRGGGPGTSTQPSLSKTTSLSTRSPKRQEEYKRMQKLFSKSKKQALNAVLTGAYHDPQPQDLPVDELFQYWRSILEKPSAIDRREPAPKADVCTQLITPISVQEIKITLESLKNSTPGFDLISKADLCEIPLIDLSAHFNWWLLTSTPPNTFKIGKMRCISTSKDISGPADTQPITMSTIIICRLFHKILAKRITLYVPLDGMRKTFVYGEGMGSHVWILRAAMSRSRIYMKRLNILFIDFRKAFYSVSHHSICVALGRMGSPKIFQKYIANLLANNSIIIESRGETSDAINIERGLRQGDPLSPFLFNAVIDLVMESLDKQVGLSVPPSTDKLSYLAFADDMVLLSETDVGLQKQLDTLVKELRLVGIKINFTKCASIRLKPLGKEKKLVVNERPFLRLAKKLIPALDVTETYNYLGIQVGPFSKPLDLQTEIEQGLELLTMAPLKPQQRLLLLRQHVIPASIHRLSFSTIKVSSLERTDECIRAMVRKWLHMQSDCSSSFLHTRVKNRGLGIPSLLHRAPLMMARRFSSVITENSDKDLELIRQLLMYSPLPNQATNLLRRV